MGAEEVAAAHYRRQKTLAQRTARQLARLWRRIDPARIAGSWRDELVAAVAVLSTSQATAAAGAGVYVDDALEELGAAADAEGRVAPGGFAGRAADGRDLAGLLYEPAITSLEVIAAGAPARRALTAGAVQLDMIVRTEVADAGRAADQAAIAARPKVGGYVRMLSLPSCSRCILLAGKFYRWNAGFQRHPRCDCRHIPASEDAAGDLRTNPMAAFRAMPAAEQDRVFTKAGAEAIRDGADLGQVVNARKGLYTAGGRSLTRVGTSRRRPVRLTTEQIYREAGGNRAEAIRLLKLHGYLF